MAALITGPEFTLEQLWQHADKTLPRYARPLFVRLLREFDLTGTFKPRKHELAQAGFDPAASTDPLYVRDSEAGRFVPLDAPIYRRLCAGDWRF